jgi:hypothetical protein
MRNVRASKCKDGLFPNIVHGERSELREKLELADDFPAP